MRYAVIGAGLAGLVSAYEIHRLAPDAEVEVFEAADRIGGKLFTVPFDGGPVDVGAEAFIRLRKDALEFFDELGLSGAIVAPSGLSSRIYSGGEQHPMPRGGAMGVPGSSEGLGGLVSEETKARIDAEGDQEGIDWHVGQDASIGRLVRDRYGDDVVDHILDSLLGGVYSSSADHLGVRATVPKLAEAFDALVEAGDKVTLSGAVARLAVGGAGAGAGAGKKRPPLFGAFAGGYSELYEALAERSGAKVFVDAFVAGVKRSGGAFQLQGAGEGNYDGVVLAVPAPSAGMLVRELAPELSAACRRIQLASSAVVAMKFDSDAGLPEQSGVLIASDEPGVHAKAFTLASKKWPHLAERGGAVVRASFGRFGDDLALRASEDDLVDWALDDLQKITGFDGRAAGLSEIYVQRWLGGIPCYDEHHLDNVAAIRSAAETVSGLQLTGAWAGGVGVPAVIADARAAAARLV